MIQLREKADIRSATRAVGLFTKMYMSLKEKLSKEDALEVAIRLTEAVIDSTFVSPEMEELSAFLEEENER
jgi:hypothetical protein